LSHGLTFGSIALLAFWTVLVAELVGDKSLYTLTTLTLRFRAGLVFSAFALASGAKMLVAVLLGSALVQLPSHGTSFVSAGAFFVSAVLIWMEQPHKGSDGELTQAAWTKGAMACFASFFLTEWGDPGQISAAALVLKSHLSTATWLGATFAMTFKGAVAMTIGIHLRDRLPQRMLRLVASASCCVLGILTLGESVLA
jgi:putative Ca2+/H+ antiporter (TMEM165/GDT1 family)